MTPLIQNLLEKRGIISQEDIATFLNPDWDAHTHSSFLLEGMERAVDRVFEAIKKNERIAVYADFDCDGIPGAVVLSDFFNRIGYKNFEVYIPHRDLEGYGFHEEAIRTLNDRGVRLIITVDVGMVAVKSVAIARELGIDVIITDHHEQIGALPDAVAILNPKLGSYPFREICGAAVAFKLVQALIAEGHTRKKSEFLNIRKGWEKWLLDVVGIATIADMVPLVGENRTLAHFGLQVLRKSPRPGIMALCSQLRLRQGALTEDDISFSIAPRINAASRMDEPKIAFDLLTTKDKMTAERLAVKLENLNASRKGVVGSIVRQAKTHVAARYCADDRVVVVGDPEWKPALLGLAANSIMQERGGVVCVWGRDGSGAIKGSCRSDGSVSLVDLFSAAGDIFLEAGGHEKSGGFSVSHDRIHSLASDLAAAAQDVAVRNSESSEKKVDAHITLPQISQSFFSDVSKLAPFGIGNPKPVFHVSNSSIRDIRRFGKENNHVEVQIQCETSGIVARAFDFFRSPEDFSLTPIAGQSAIILATIERDSYRGGLALRLVDIHPSSKVPI